MELGELIRTEREKLGLSKVDLAKRADVSPSAITMLEKGDRAGRIDTIARIAAVLGIPSSVIFSVTLGNELERSAQDQPYVISQVEELLRRVNALEKRERPPDDDVASGRGRVAFPLVPEFALR